MAKKSSLVSTATFLVHFLKLLQNEHPLTEKQRTFPIWGLYWLYYNFVVVAEVKVRKEMV